MAMARRAISVREKEDTRRLYVYEGTQRRFVAGRGLAHFAAGLCKTDD
jgi:hypothetical protein